MYEGARERIEDEERLKKGVSPFHLEVREEKTPPPTSLSRSTYDGTVWMQRRREEKTGGAVLNFLGHLWVGLSKTKKKKNLGPSQPAKSERNF